MLWLAVASTFQFVPFQCTLQIDSIRNSMACHVTSDSDFDKRGCVIQIKLSVTITKPCSKLLCTEVREVHQISIKQTLVFRT